MTGIPIALLGVSAIARWPLRPVPVRAPGRHPYREWIVVGVAILVWEIVVYTARGSRAAHPTFSSMVDAVDRFYLLKALLFFGWLCVCAVVRASGHRPEGAMTSSVFYAVWAALGAALLGVWALSRRAGSGLAGPADVVRRAATGPVARLVLVGALMFAGWHFFAR